MKPDDGKGLLEEQSLIMERLETLKVRVMQIQADIPCIEESCLLSSVLEEPQQG